jgi:hypothetical protein
MTSLHSGERQHVMMQAGVTAQLHCPVLTCNVTFKGIRENTDSRVEHPRSHRAALLAACYPVLTSECSCYITVLGSSQSNSE